MKKLLSITLAVLTLLGLLSGCNRKVELQDNGYMTWPTGGDKIYSYIGPNGEVIISTVPPEDFDWPGYDSADEPTEEPIDEPTEPADEPTQPTQGTQPTQEPTQSAGHYHNWLQAENIRASCDVPGEVIFWCVDCGESRTESVPAGHQYDRHMSWDSPCVSGVGEAYRCIYCGDEYEVLLEEPKGHDLTTTVLVEPTCEKPGRSHNYCHRCDREFEKEIPKLGHDFTEATCKQWAICLRCGEKGNAPHGHMDDGTKHCAYCGESLAMEVIGTPQQFCFYAAGDWWLDIQWYAANNSGKTISRFRITVEAYDASGNLVYGKTSKWRDGVADGETFGLTAHFTPKISEMDELASFQTITSVKITQIEIEYADGSTMKGIYGFSTETIDAWIHEEAFYNEF